MTIQSSGLPGYYQLTYDPTDDHCSSGKKQMFHTTELPFITALKNGGTKEEAIFALERMWEEMCALRAEVEKLRGVPQEQLVCDCGAPTEGKWADKHTAGCASLNMTCPFCGGPGGNIAAEYVTCGAAWNPDCPGHQVKAPTDDNNCRMSTLWNTRP